MIRDMAMKAQIVAASSFPPALLTNLVAWWKMDEASGTRVNSVSPGTHNLIPTGTVNQVAGKISNASQTINGTTDGLSCPATAAFSFTNSVSFAGWVARGSDSQFCIFGNLSTSSPGNYACIFYGNSGAFLSLQLNNGSTFFHNFGAYVFPIGVYRHVVITFDRPTLTARCYLDGVLVGTGIGSIAPTTTFEQQIAVGSLRPYFSNNNSVDEFGFWSRVLTAAEVSQLYNGGAGITY